MEVNESLGGYLHHYPVKSVEESACLHKPCTCFGEDMYPLAIQNLGEGVEKESINKKETPAKPCADQSD